MTIPTLSVFLQSQLNIAGSLVTPDALVRFRTVLFLLSFALIGMVRLLKGLVDLIGNRGQTAITVFNSLWKDHSVPYSYASPISAVLVAVLLLARPPFGLFASLARQDLNSLIAPDLESIGIRAGEFLDVGTQRKLEKNQAFDEHG